MRLKKTCFITLLAVVSIQQFAVATIYKDRAITFEMDVQRNNSLLALLGDPLDKGWYWESTQYAPNGTTMSEPFCQTNITSIAQTMAYQDATFHTNENYTQAAVFDLGNVTAIYLTDLAYKKIDILVFNQSQRNDSHRRNPNDDGSRGHHHRRVLDHDDPIPTLNSLPKTQIDLVSNDFTFANANEVYSHHLLKVNDTSLLVEVNGGIKIYNATLDQLAKTSFFQTNITNCTGVVALNGYLFISSSSRLQIYNLNTSTSNTLTLIKVLIAENFNSAPSINIISLTLDVPNQLLYVLDTVQGIFIVNISSLPSKADAAKMNMESIGNMKSIRLAGDGVLLAQFYDMITNSEAISELLPNSTNLTAAYYSIVRTHSTFPDIDYLDSDRILGYVTLSNVINVFFTGIPSKAVPAAGGNDLTISLVNVQLAVPFHIAGQTYLFTAGKTQYTIYQIDIIPPYVYCFPPDDAEKGTFNFSTTIWTSNCSLKANYSDIDPLSYCKIDVVIILEVWDALLRSARIGLAVGLGLGLTFTAVAVGFCIYYYRKVRKYRHLMNEDERGGRPERGSAMSNQEKKSPRSEGMNYQIEMYGKNQDAAPIHDKDVEIQISALKGHTNHKNQVEQIDHIEIADHNMDDIYKED